MSALASHKPTPATQATHYGAITSLNPRLIIGWARLNAESAPLWVELLGDGESLGVISASADFGPLYPQLPPEAAGHSFIYHLPETTSQGIGKITARIANTPYHLSGSGFPNQLLPLSAEEKPTNKSTNRIGWVENHGGLRLCGWAIPTTQDHQSIHVFEHGQQLATTQANLLDPHALHYGAPSIQCGFSLDLPLQLADGKQHQLDILTADNVPLHGSPITVILPENGLLAWASQLPVQRTEQALLENLARQLTHYAPRSLGFDAYAEWFNCFGIPPNTAITPDVSRSKILVAIAAPANLADNKAQQTELHELISRSLLSLLAQSHSNWQALIPEALLTPTSRKKLPKDPRILPVNAAEWDQHVTATIATSASSEALLALLPVGDTLAPQALAMAATAMLEKPHAQALYSDCDIPTQAANSTHGTTHSPSDRTPWFKPDWDPDLYLSQPLLQHLFVGRAAQFQTLPAKYRHNPFSWPWYIASKAQHIPGAILHLPWVLHHQHDANTQHDPVLRKHWLPHLDSEVQLDKDGRLSWNDPDIWPSVTLIIPTRNRADLLKTCLDSLRKADYSKLDIIVIDNDSTENDSLSYFAEIKALGVSVMHHAGPFNFAAMNNRAVSLARGEIIGLINNDIEALDKTWLKTMVRQLLRPNVGAVGAKLLWPNRMVQHAGVLIGLHGLAGHIGNNWHEHDAGYFGLNQMPRRVSAVTAACLLCWKQDYQALDGMDEQAFPVNFNDVDFCLRLNATGKHILWTPEATLLHAESVSRGADETPSKQARLEREKNAFWKRWPLAMRNDSHYNPNLNLDRYSHFGLAYPPRHTI